MEMSDESDEEDWFVGHMKREAGTRELWGKMKAGRLDRELLQESRQSQLQILDHRVYAKLDKYHMRSLIYGI